MRRRLDNRFSVSGQIRVEDIRALAEDGVTVLINNRPETENRFSRRRLIVPASRGWPEHRRRSS